MIARSRVPEFVTIPLLLLSACAGGGGGGNSPLSGTGPSVSPPIQISPLPNPITQISQLVPSMNFQKAYAGGTTTLYTAVEDDRAFPNSAGASSYTYNSFPDYLNNWAQLCTGQAVTFQYIVIGDIIDGEYWGPKGSGYEMGTDYFISTAPTSPDPLTGNSTSTQVSCSLLPVQIVPLTWNGTRFTRGAPLSATSDNKCFITLPAGHYDGIDLVTNAQIPSFDVGVTYLNTANESGVNCLTQSLLAPQDILNSYGLSGQPSVAPAWNSPSSQSQSLDESYSHPHSPRVVDPQILAHLRAGK